MVDEVLEGMSLRMTIRMKRTTLLFGIWIQPDGQCRNHIEKPNLIWINYISLLWLVCSLSKGDPYYGWCENTNLSNVSPMCTSARFFIITWSTNYCGRHLPPLEISTVWSSIYNQQKQNNNHMLFLMEENDSGCECRA